MAKKLIVGITIPGSIGLLKGQLNYFSTHGYDAYLLTQHNDKSLAYCEREGCGHLDVKIAREISLWQDVKTLFALIRIFRKEKPDIVNVGTPKMGLLGMIAAWWCRVPNRIYTCRGFRYETEKGKNQTILRITEKIAGACAKKIICISPSLCEVAIKDKIFSANKCVVINKGSSNGINLYEFDISQIKSEDQQNLKKQWGIRDEFVFGFLGRIRDDKGINELFEAFKIVYSSNSNCKLLVVGPWDQGHIKNPKLLEEMTQHPAVILPGRTDHATLCLSIMSTFVLPTWREGFGNVFVEAAAMGIPVIGSDVTGSKSAVCDNYNGLLVNPHDVLSISEAMFKMMNDDNLRNFFCNNGKKWAKNFSNEIVWEGMNELYKAY